MWTPIIFLPLLLSSAIGQPTVLISPEERFKESSHFSRLHDSASSPILGDSTEAAPFEEFEFELLDNGEEAENKENGELQEAGNFHQKTEVESDVGERLIEDVDNEDSEDESSKVVQSPSPIGSAKVEDQLEDSNGNATIKSETTEKDELLLQSNPSSQNPSPSNVSHSSELTTSTAVASTLPLPQDDNPTFNPIPSEPGPVLCASVNEHPTFIRHTNPSFLQTADGGTATANFARKMDSLSECANTCRQNVDPIDGQPFQCNGFTYASRNFDNSCQFFDDKVMVSKSEDANGQNPSKRLAYFERICLTIPDECVKSVFSFENYPKMFLPIESIEVISVDDRKRCLDFCLTNTACRAINYNTANGTCEVLDQTWRAVVGGLADHPEFDYYENTCFQEKSRCPPQRRIDFLITKNTELEAFDVAAGQLSVRNCMRECVESDSLFCRSFEYNHATKQCFLAVEGYDQVVPSLPSSTLPAAITSTEHFDLFEPVCLDEAIDLPCQGDHVFERLPNMNLLNEGEPIYSQEIPNTTLELCMDACLHNDSCLSFTFARTHQLCKIMSFDRSYNFTLPILETHVDYFELSCDRNAVLKTPENHVQDTSSNQQSKIHSESVSNLSATHQETLPSGANNDYQNSLTNSTKMGSPPLIVCDTPRSILIERGRTLRLEYRNLHHVNVRDFNQCETLCETAPITCATFAYNDRSSDCLISTTTIDRNSRFSLLTQPNANYELYTFVGASCLQGPSATGESSSKTVDQPSDLPVITLPPSTTTPFPELIREFTATVVFEKSEDQVNEISTTIPETTISTITTAFTTLPDGEEQEEHNLEQPIQGEEHEEEVTTLSSEPEEHAIDAFLNKANTSNSTEETDKEEEEITEVLIDSDNLKHKLNDEGSEAELSDQVARNQIHPADSFRPGIPRKVASMTTVDGSKVHVNAMCLHHGVNVTFRILNQAKYTGAVYAAERFSQCRIFVEDKQEFAIFIHRPNFNNLCNALETDGELAAVLVMSNDMVLPYDVTTKDDFFYQISCDYQAGDSEDSVVEGEGSDSSKNAKELHSGIVVGGPEPKFVMSSGRAAISHHNHRRPHADDMQTRVNLRILRNGRPVNNVFIGERLTAVVESDIDASRLSVADCNATRVGGRQPRPNSVQLIDRGCTLMPQIIGNMVRGQNGLEAPLTAFRIDGSDQIDIVCSVVVCRIRCPDKPNKCPVIRTRRAPTARDADQDTITVDHRLRVMVADDELDEENQEDEDSSKHSYKASSHQPKHSNALLRFFDIDSRNGVGKMKHNIWKINLYERSGVDGVCWGICEVCRDAGAKEDQVQGGWHSDGSVKSLIIHTKQHPQYEAKLENQIGTCSATEGANWINTTPNN